VAVLIELPALWTFTVVPLVCPTADGTAAVRYFVLDHGELIVDSKLKTTYDVISISLGFIVPVGVLLFCNCHLISSLRQSYRMTRLYRASTAGRVSRDVSCRVSRGVAAKSSAQNAETRLTLTLVCVVAMFLLLVTPSELVNLYFYAARPTDQQLLRQAIVVTNVLQTANFSFNFILYLAVNSQFRGAVAEAVRCPRRLWACCRRLPLTTTAMTLETVLPTPAPPPSLAVSSSAAGVVVVETVNTPSREEQQEQTVSVVEVHRVALNRSDDDNDDYDDERHIDDC